MISNALPKVTNLRRAHITMRWKDLQKILKMLHLHCPKLAGLSIQYAEFLNPFSTIHIFELDPLMELESSSSPSLLTSKISPLPQRVERRCIWTSSSNTPRLNSGRWPSSIAHGPTPLPLFLCDTSLTSTSAVSSREILSTKSFPTGTNSRPFVCRANCAASLHQPSGPMQNPSHSFVISPFG